MKDWKNEDWLKDIQSPIKEIDCLRCGSEGKITGKFVEDPTKKVTIYCPTCGGEGKIKIPDIKY